MELFRKHPFVFSAAVVFIIVLLGIVIFRPESTDSSEPQGLPSGLVVSLSTERASYNLSESVPVRASISNTASDALTLSSGLFRGGTVALSWRDSRWAFPIHSFPGFGEATDLVLSPGETKTLFEIAVPLSPVECVLDSAVYVEVKYLLASAKPLATIGFTVVPVEAPFLRIRSDGLVYQVGEPIALRVYLCNPTSGDLTVGTPTTPEWAIAIFNSTGTNLTWWSRGLLMAPGSVTAPARSEVPMKPGGYDDLSFEFTYGVERIVVDGIEYVGSEYTWSQYSRVLESGVPEGVYRMRAEVFGFEGSPKLYGETVVHIARI